MRLVHRAAESCKKAGIGFIEFMEAFAVWEEASALDVVVETDMTDVCVMLTAEMEVICEVCSWHDAGAVAGTVVVVVVVVIAVE